MKKNILQNIFDIGAAFKFRKKNNIHMLAFILCKTNTCICELSVAQLLRFLMVESAHPDLSPRFGMGCSYFPGYILGFNRRYSF